jgi:NAD(P)-dependent dehydrogenase (short-subunit alcohol dehydrogenase family)
VTRICVLTGASGTLGSAFINRCATQFRIVAVHHRHEIDYATQDQLVIDPLDPTRPLEANAEPVFAIRADLSNHEAIDTVCDEVLDRYGQIDLLINAAAYRRFAPLGSSTLRDAERTFSVNVLAPLRLAIGFAERYWSARRDDNIALRRHVLNISSTAGLYIYPDLGQALYSASKAALNYGTYHLASELWDMGVRANTLAPNTFPNRVSTGRVVDEILALDDSIETGRVVVVDK